MRRWLLRCFGLPILFAASVTAEPARIVLIAGTASHGHGTHEFNAGSELLAEALRESGLDLDVVLFRNGWPGDPEALVGTRAIVVYMDGGRSHPVLSHMAQVEAAVSAGSGLLFMHYALEVPQGSAADTFDRWIGGSYEDGKSTNPVWTPELSLAEDHPATRGVSPFRAPDEWYFNLRLAEEQPGFRRLLTAVPDDKARQNPTWPRSPNEEVLANRGRREVLAWTLESRSGGRGAGFTGGHFHWNWGQDAYRKLVLNTIIWVAGLEVPPTGVSSPPLTFERLREGQDEGEPWFFFDADVIRERFGFPTEPPS